MPDHDPPSESPSERPRGADGRYLRTLEGAQLDAEACRMRSAGKTYQQIADELGYCDRHRARRAVEGVLAETVTESGDELRKLELDHLDELRQAAGRVLARRHVTVSHGKIMYGADGEPILDDGPELAAIDRLVKVAERRARLLGLDAPTKVEASGQVAYVLVSVDDEQLK